jgi:hypothetical protein
MVILGYNFYHIIKKKTKIDKTKKSTNQMLARSAKALIEQISDYLKIDNLKHWVLEDDTVIRLGIELEDKECYELFIMVPEKQHYIEFKCVVQIDVPDESVLKTAEMIARINQFFSFGHLIFYFETREVVFENVMILYENELTANKFKLFFEHTFNGAKHCRPLIQKVVLEGEDPVLAMMNWGMDIDT